MDLIVMEGFLALLQKSKLRGRLRAVTNTAVIVNFLGFNG
jgi:hypothetical protein